MSEKIDVSALSIVKGGFIPNSTIAGLTAVSVHDPGFWKAAWAVEKAIRKHLHEQGHHSNQDGDGEWSVRVLEEGIAILTDAEAVSYNKRLHKASRRKFFKSWRQLRGIDTAQLDPEAQSEYERTFKLMNNERRALRDAVDPYSLLGLTSE